VADPRAFQKTVPMSRPDPFGQKRERRITKSGVRDVFTPHHPVHHIDLLHGRRDEVRRLLENINTLASMCCCTASAAFVRVHSPASWVNGSSGIDVKSFDAVAIRRMSSRRSSASALERVGAYGALERVETSDGHENRAGIGAAVVQVGHHRAKQTTSQFRVAGGVPRRSSPRHWPTSLR
jgi:hypothetical protein